ncbi:MAG: PAS domain S-box protein [Acidobacteriota bacterium]
MKTDENEERLLRLVALENARSVRLTRDRVEQELARTRDALQKSEMWLRMALKNADLGVWRADLSTGLGTRDASVNRILGLAAVESTQPIDDCFRMIHPEDKAGVVAAWVRAVENKGAYEAEFRIVRDDGSIRCLREKGRFVGAENGQPDFITGVTLDITERKDGEAASARLAAIVESSDDAIISKDLNGIIMSWNAGAERLFGYTEKEMIGRPIFLLIPPDRLDEEAEILKRLSHGEHIEHIETVRCRKDGTMVHVSLSSSPISDTGGRIVGASSIARDISERKRIEAELQRLMNKEREARQEAEIANRVKDEFIAMISHELRTPLNAIAGWTQLLKSRKLSEQDREKAIQTIDRNATAQAAIIDELLDVARIISGKLRLDMKPVDLAGVIDAAVDVVRPAANAKEIEIVTSLERPLGLVAGDSTRLQQVIWNLLTNAIKFTPQRGRIDIALNPVGPQLRVVVSDTGPGIPLDFLPHIFERFRQADCSATRVHGGLGLGLSIVRYLVEMHGGTIQAENRGEGQGAQFTITVPMMVVQDLSGEGSEFSHRDGVPDAERGPELALDLLRGLKVLTVDDQPDTCDLIALALTRYGAEVRASTSATEALKAMEKWKPDVLISDIGMPTEDGYDLMRKIRALEPERGGLIPAIALTGFAGSSDKVRALSAGFHLHITKPVELRELAATVAQLSGR